METKGMTEYLINSAIISGCGKYRYRLERKWADGPIMTFVMLNPSTADAYQDDPTIRRCVGFAKALGYGHLIVVNMYAIRSTDPHILRGRAAEECRGPQNQFHIEQACKVAKAIVFAWGTHGYKGHHITQAMEIAFSEKIFCFGTTKYGFPKHPLYLPKDAPLIPWAGGARP